MTIRIRPIEGESLVSFLYRSAKRNKLKILDIYKYILEKEYNAIHNRSLYLLDINPGAYINIKKFIQLFGIKSKTINKMSFKDLISKFTESDDPEDIKYYTREISMYIDKGFYKVCLTCYKKDSTMPLIWRLSGTLNCHKHKEKLIKICIKCMQSLDSNNINAKESQCASCGKMLKPNLNYGSTDYKDWEYLLNTNTSISGKIPTLTLSQSIACLFLYVSLGQGCDYELGRVKGLQRDESKKLCRLVRNNNIKPVRPNLTHLFKLLNARALNVTISELSRIKVSSEFLDSLLKQNSKKVYNEHLVLPVTYKKPKCQTPWCSEFGKSEHLFEIKKHPFTKDFDFVYICYSCCIKLGINKEGKVVVVGNRLALISYAMEKLNNGYLKKDLKFYTFLMDEITGYLFRYNLLENENYTLSTENELRDIKRFKNIIVKSNCTDKEEIYRVAKELYSWSMGYFFYLFFTPEIQESLINVYRWANEGKGKNIGEELEAQLKYSYENNIKITYTQLAKSLNVCRDTVSKHSSIVKYYQEMQHKHLEQVEQERLREKAIEYVKAVQLEYKEVQLMEAYKKIGRSIPWLKSNAPEIISWLKKEKGKERK